MANAVTLVQQICRSGYSVVHGFSQINLRRRGFEAWRKASPKGQEPLKPSH
jgi:hypothetical protein